MRQTLTSTPDMNVYPDSHRTDDNAHITRRRFIAGTGASVLAFTVLKPELVRGAEANSKINIGLIGCGGRGQVDCRPVPEERRL